MGSSNIDSNNSVDLINPVEESSSIDLVKGTDDRCAIWKFSLIGRFDLVRLKFSEVVLDLKSQWKLTGQCKMIPLGKGFFTIKLDNEKDQGYIKAGKWEVRHQELWIRNWIPNFRPENHRTSFANIWVHFPGLSLEYWDEQTLFTICKALGTPVKVDEATLNFESGLYARVLVNIDLAKKIPHNLWIKTKFGGFMQDVLLTNLPKFCHNCKIAGHFQFECRVKKVSHETRTQQNISNSPLVGSTSKNQDNNDSQKLQEVNKSTTSPTSTPHPTNGEKFDIYFTPVTNINPQKFIPPHSSHALNITSGRFGSLNTVVKEEIVINMTEERTIIDPTRISQIAEDNTVEKSVINFISGKYGSISEERIPITTWSKVIQKPSASKATSSTEQIQQADPKVKFL
ncbi:uncharacterized protein LOC113312703 [Papaver somniferum]|uniref:uncharacterized protein LOC113312703 n=1 Tax=Papaver somniferum TaxID=3469 RepID=UPI000E704797|nr:uncharacterized protein LOC113312703 [Papaver somniferum]